jgi:hypothetical protein
VRLNPRPQKNGRSVVKSEVRVSRDPFGVSQIVTRITALAARQLTPVDNVTRTFGLIVRVLVV